MPVIAIPKEDAIAIVYENKAGQYVKVSRELIDHTRWDLVYRLIIKDTETDKFYATTYTTGATEYQDYGPFEFDEDEIEFVEVAPYEEKVIVYKEV